MPQALSDDYLGGVFEHLLETLHNVEDGLLGVSRAGFGDLPAATGVDAATLTATETYITNRFLPALRAAIAGKPAAVIMDPADAIYA